MGRTMTVFLGRPGGLSLGRNHSCRPHSLRNIYLTHCRRLLKPITALCAFISHIELGHGKGNLLVTTQHQRVLSALRSRTHPTSGNQPFWTRTSLYQSV